MYCFLILAKGGYTIPNAWQCNLELIFQAILELASNQIGKGGKKYFPIILVLFLFILVSNVIGLVPYSFTTTSHFSITCSFSFTVCIGVTILALILHKIRFFGYFLPPGAPLVLIPFLVVIELVSYIFRPISLGVRLFANMMAGHTLLKILAGFAWKKH